MSEGLASAVLAEVAAKKRRPLQIELVHVLGDATARAS